MTSGILQNIADALGTQEAAIKFLLSIALCFPIALFLRGALHKQPAHVKHLCFSVLTLTLGFFNYGLDCIHFLITILVNYLLLQVVGGTALSVILSFIFNMGYLLTAYVYVSTDGYDIIWTTPQCIMTLRLIGLAFDLYDGNKPMEKLSSEQKKICLSHKPSLLEVFSYTFYIGGFFAGPQFPLRDYLDFIHERNEYSEITKYHPPSSTGPALKQLLQGVLMLVLGSLLLPKYGPAQIASEKFETGSFLFKCFALSCLGYTFFFNYLGVWMVTEGACIASGFGYNGKDEQGNDKWDKLVGSHPLGLATTPYFKGMISHFNLTTNQWAARYVYKRCRFLGNRYISQVVTLGFLAVWHGLYPGYYISFLLEVMTVFPETTIQGVVTRKIPLLRSIVDHPAMQWPLYIVLKLWLSVFWGYSILPFIFLRWDRIYHLYSQVYFMGHIVYGLWPLLYMFVILPYIKKISKQEEKDSEKKAD